MSTFFPLLHGFPGSFLEVISNGAINMNESLSFYEVQNLVLKFERLLKENDIAIERGGDLENKYWSVF